MSPDRLCMRMNREAMEEIINSMLLQGYLCIDSIAITKNVVKLVFEKSDLFVTPVDIKNRDIQRVQQQTAASKKFQEVKKENG